MIKRTLYFGNPAYLCKRNEQLEITLPQAKEIQTEELTAKVPIEDIGIVVLDHQQITITQALLASLLENNVAVITCDSTHHPAGLLLPLSGNSVQTEKFRAQIDATVPLKKNLWQQTVSSKILNQAAFLKQKNIPADNMLHWADSVRSGDPDNYEARAAAYYWKSLSPFLTKAESGFFRERFGAPPNNLLNYGYSILRAIVARGLVASGLLPTLGIHHRNKYNAFCLADDIMEPYRPFVDALVCTIIENGEDYSELTTAFKKQLLSIATVDIKISDEKSPLMVGMSRTTASLSKCFEGETRKILYPELI